MSYTKLDLLQDLADMGLTGQETILIHSSMKPSEKWRVVRILCWMPGWNILRTGYCYFRPIPGPM